MYERRRYVTETRRGREQRYRRMIVRASAAAVLLHAMLIPVAAPFTERIPLVRRSGYRGEIRLLPEISVLREPDLVKSEVEARAGELAESSFKVVNLSVTELDAAHDRPTEIVIEHFVKPLYPQSAIEAGIEGVAVFGIQIAATGNVVRAWLVESEVNGDCNIEAQRALLQ